MQGLWPVPCTGAPKNKKHTSNTWQTHGKHGELSKNNWEKMTHHMPKIICKYAQYVQTWHNFISGSEEDERRREHDQTIWNLSMTEGMDSALQSGLCKGQGFTGLNAEPNFLNLSEPNLIYNDLQWLRPSWTLYILHVIWIKWIEQNNSITLCHTRCRGALFTKSGLFFSKGKMAQVIGATQGWNLHGASSGRSLTGLDLFRPF